MKINPLKYSKRNGKQPWQNETENKTENISNTVRRPCKKGLKNNFAENKIRDAEGIEGNHEKEKKPVQRKIALKIQQI